MKSKKGFWAGFLSCALVCSMIGSAVAAYTRTETLHFNDIKIKINGEYANFVNSEGGKIEPFIINGTTYLPVANVAKEFGYSVKWDGATQTVILEQPEAQKATYITRTGSKYHNDPHCNGGTYWEVPYSTAVGMGLTPCEKCVHTKESAEPTETTADVLLASKDHIRFYYTGLIKNADGSYGFKIRCENDSDYTIFAYTKDLTINGKTILNMANASCIHLDCTVEPGRTLDTVIIVDKSAIDKYGITEVKRFKTGFAGYDTKQSGWHFETGGTTIDVNG